MSLLASCPACGTTFRVRAEHLAAHRGDVRCGQCLHVFNALSHLTEVADAPPLAPVAACPNAIAPSVETIPTVVIPEPSPHANSFESPVLESLPHHAEINAKPRNEVDAIQDANDFSKETLFAATDPEPASILIVPTAEESPSLTVRAPERRRLRTALLATLTVSLMLTALLQTGYFLRTELAARYPALRPLLEQACTLAGCTVELPRNVELLAIDDSDLQEDAEFDGVMVLTASLLNHAPYPQQYPSIELTLTDLDDKPVLRRRISPREYLPPDMSSRSGIPAGGEAHVNLRLQAKDVQATGYRVYLTYY